jgi:hypothetical protein
MIEEGQMANNDVPEERIPVLRDLIGAFEVGMEGSPIEENHVVLYADAPDEPWARYLSVDGISYKVSVEALS